MLGTFHNCAYWVLIPQLHNIWSVFAYSLCVSQSSYRVAQKKSGFVTRGEEGKAALDTHLPLTQQTAVYEYWPWQAVVNISVPRHSQHQLAGVHTQGEEVADARQSLGRRRIRERQAVAVVIGDHLALLVVSHDYGQKFSRCGRLSNKCTHQTPNLRAFLGSRSHRLGRRRHREPRRRPRSPATLGAAPNTWYTYH